MRRLILAALLALCATANAQLYPLGSAIGTLQVPYNASGNWLGLSISGSGDIAMTSGSAINLGSSTNLPCSAMPALTGAVTSSAGSCVTSGGGSGLTSVGLSTTASWFTIGNSPLTANGTITMNPTSGLTANEFVATPNGSSGAVGLRAMVAADLPSAITSNTSGTAANITATSNSTLTTLSALLLPYSQLTGTPSVPAALASGSQALSTSTISSGTCATTIQVAVAGGTTSDTASITMTTDPNTVTGYKASATGTLYATAFMTSGELNIEVCNSTASSITPSAMSVHYLVTSP